MSVAAKTREDTASMTREHKFLGGNRGKNFDETVRLQSEIRREVRGGKLQGVAEGASSALHLASLSAASFPGRNKCPGTHCSLIEQKEREDSSCQICHRVWDKRKDGGEDRAARTERESDRRKGEEKWQSCWCCRGQQRACRMAQASAEKLERTGPAEKERVASVPQRKQLTRTPEPPLPKGTEPSVQSTRSWGGRESRWARASPWRERGGSEREHGVEGWTPRWTREDSKEDREGKQEEPP